MSELQIFYLSTLNIQYVHGKLAFCYVNLLQHLGWGLGGWIHNLCREMGPRRLVSRPNSLSSRILHDSFLWLKTLQGFPSHLDYVPNPPPAYKVLSDLTSPWPHSSLTLNLSLLLACTPVSSLFPALLLHKPPSAWVLPVESTGRGRRKGTRKVTQSLTCLLHHFCSCWASPTSAEWLLPRPW